MIRLYLYAALAIALLGGSAYGAHALYAAGRRAGTDACEAAHAKAADAAAKEQERRDTAASDAGQSMLDYLAANLPPAETQNHEAIERVRIIYRDHPVVCTRPVGVQDELTKARERANTATGGVRSGSHPGSPAHP